MESKPKAQKTKIKIKDQDYLLKIKIRYSGIQWEQQDSASLPLTPSKYLLQMCKMGIDCKQT